MKSFGFFKSEKSNDGDAPWKPTYKWMATVAGIILITLIVVFFVLNIVLKPYMRELPAEITPWLKKPAKELKAETAGSIIVQGEQNGENQSPAE